MTDVVVLGGAGVDTIVYVPELPLPYKDSYLVPAIESRAGQTGDNVAIGLSALGFEVVHIDVLGDDREGDVVAALHERCGVPLVRLPTAAGTKRAVGLVGQDGRRLSLYDGSRGDPGDRFETALLTKHQARHFHVSITHPCRDALDVVAGLPVTVSVDLHNWDGVNPYHEQFAYAADIVFMSATALPDREPVMRRIVARGRAQVVVATDGAEGGLYLHEGVVHRYHPASLPAPAVDSNGAGDAFVSGFLFGHLTGRDVASSVHFGAIAGAHACTVSSAEVRPIDRATLLARS